MANAQITETEDDILYSRSKSFIDLLRQEASDAKSCVTQYSFQSLAISAASVGFIITNSKDSPLSMLAVIPIIAILIITARIAIYKYELANRAYGYEFYLTTMLGLYDKSDSNQLTTPPEDIKCWKFVVKNEHWERTYFAWRIIHSTMFNSYYHIDYYNNPLDILYLNRFTLQKDHIKELETKPTLPLTDWFLCGREFDVKKKTFVKNKNVNGKFLPDYHAGGYLSNILSVIVIMQVFLLVPLFLTVVKLGILVSSEVKFDMLHVFNPLESLTEEQRKNVISFMIAIIGLLGIGVFSLLVGRRVRRRERILEKGLNSIRSASLIWSIVFKLHHKAWCDAKESIKTDQSKLSVFKFEDEYNRRLFFYANKIAENSSRLDEWGF